MKQLMSGNEAIARGAYEAGVNICSAYPGTPSTEIFDNLPNYKDALYCEWAPNEKVATEVAYGASIAGARSMCAMKHVGLNVASDPMFTAAYLGVNGGFVIITADDPSMHSSQNEQDNRWYAKHAKLPLIEPADSQECKDFMAAAFDISERFDVPVLFRTTTRVAHSKSIVELGERREHAIPEYKANPRKFVCTPAGAYQNRAKIEGIWKELAEYSNVCPLNSVEERGTKIGVISAGMAYMFAKEVFPEDTSFLKLGLTNPLPMELIRSFAARVETLYVIEELDGYMEEQIKAAGIDCIGKAVVSPMYELNPEILREEIFGVKPETKVLDVKPVPRPPALCPGCPHRGFFYCASKIKDVVITGDIGCYTLGAAPPLNASDTCVCMGGGFTVGAGIARALEQSGQKKKVIGVVGDSTFFHSGITGAVEIIYNNAGMVPVVLDNHTTGMTGHQDNPGTGYNLQGEVAAVIKIEDVLHAVGFENVIIVDPNDLAAMAKALDDAFASEKRAAIIARRPCLLIKRERAEKKLCAVDTAKCIGCKKCLSVGCPALMMKNGKSYIEPELCVGCTVCAQVCPVKAIGRKEE